MQESCVGWCASFSAVVPCVCFGVVTGCVMSEWYRDISHMACCCNATLSTQILLTQSRVTVSRLPLFCVSYASRLSLSLSLSLSCHLCVSLSFRISHKHLLSLFILSRVVVSLLRVSCYTATLLSPQRAGVKVSHLSLSLVSLVRVSCLSYLSLSSLFFLSRAVCPSCVSRVHLVYPVSRLHHSPSCASSRIQWHPTPEAITRSTRPCIYTHTHTHTHIHIYKSQHIVCLISYLMRFETRLWHGTSWDCHLYGYKETVIYAYWQSLSSMCIDRVCQLYG